MLKRSDKTTRDDPSTGEPAAADHFRRLAEWTPVGIIETDLDANVLYTNDRWRQITGRDLSVPFGRAELNAIVHPDDRANIGRMFQMAIDEVSEYDTTCRIIRPDGSIVHVRTQGAPSLDEHGRMIGFIGSLMDLTELVETQDALRDSESRYRAVIDSLHGGLIVHTADRVLSANESAGRIIGATPDQLLDGDFLVRIPVYDADGNYVRVSDRPSLVALRTGEPVVDVTHGIDNPDGTRHWYLVNATPLFVEDAATPYAVALSYADITDRKEAQEQTDRLASIVESTSDLVAIVDWRSGHVLYLNQSARVLFGYVGADLTDVHHRDLFALDSSDGMMQSVEATMRRGEVWSGELPMLAADGSVVLVWQTIAAERRADGHVYQVAAVGRDVTERRRFEAELAWQATHDSLTGLPNRSLLLDHLELSLARAERDKQLVALLFLDLDRFKQVNDLLGHEQGDELLVQTAARLSRVLRPADTVARIGGDEFVVLAEDVDDEDHAIAIGRRVAAAIDHPPFVLGDQSFDITSSIGIAVSHGHEAHPEALLRDADAAMYRAKDLGRARLEVFDESMRERAEQRNDLANQLAAGIEHDDIVVYYQPCIDLTTGRITAVEALARWTHPERGVLSPYEFIALAEETGLIVGLGLSVLSKACHQAHAWEQLLGAVAPRVHVNLSARQLTARNLPTLVEGVLSGTGLSPGRLCLEITESVLMDDAASVIDTLWALKGIGVSLAIDDFGTGYSSLSYLRRFPVDVLKVDQSFVDGLGPDPEDSAIVAAIINLAASLELDAIAEGVETQEQLDRLRELGCHSAQGFLFAEPRPANEVGVLFGTTFAL